MNLTNPPVAHVIGDPIAQSKSPAIHRFWLQKLGLIGTYDAKQVAQGELSRYFDEVSGIENWVGCNVTMPHKQAIIPHLDEVDPLAAKLGAVNTVVRQPDGRLVGYNTDAEGFLEPLLPLLATSHLFRMARVFGNGGAARAIISALSEKGFTLVVAGRDPTKARALLDELAPQGEHYAVDLAHFATPTDFAFDNRQGCLDLIINASPLGMTGKPPLIFDWTHAPPGAIAYDIVTSPAETPFLADARSFNHPVIGGLAMLIGQAAAAFKKFYKSAPPREFDDELLEVLAQ